MTAEQTAAYIASCAANRTKTDYFSSRGISEQTAARFSLGYDGALSCVVLPCDGGHVVRRSTAEKRYLNEKGVPSPLFQSALLRGGEPTFLVEGVFDALSAEELGFRACAMNRQRQPHQNCRAPPHPRALRPHSAPAGQRPRGRRVGDRPHGRVSVALPLSSAARGQGPQRAALRRRGRGRRFPYPLPDRPPCAPAPRLRHALRRRANGRT